MRRFQIFFISKRVFLILMLLSVLSACVTLTDTTATAPELQQLRITNSSNMDIVGLVVLFPGLSADAESIRVEFGNIPVGETTEYKNVPSGVYNYAAYEYKVDGRVITQFVTDWMGKSPMAVRKFTYELVLDPKKVPGGQLTLVAVRVDEP